ncbi:MAG: hypothetical protein HDT43_08830 [Ruminococcaceae bacterium]|nr:hypothetical protein [Oscillospiraceae bacterium]
MKKSKRVWGKAFLTLLGIVSVWLVASSVIGLIRPLNNSNQLNIGDRVEFVVDYGVPIYTYESPFTGHKDYYYAVYSVYSNNNEYATIVKANSSWAENNFNGENGAANKTVLWRGTIKKFRVPQEMKSIERDIAARYGVGIRSDYYIDLTAQSQYLRRFNAGVAIGTVCVVLAILTAVFTRKRRRSAAKEVKECQERKSSDVIY